MNHLRAFVRISSVHLTRSLADRARSLIGAQARPRRAHELAN